MSGKPDTPETLEGWLPDPGASGGAMPWLDDLKREAVDVPEWGGEIYVRELTGMEGAVLDSWLVANKDNKVAVASGFNAMMVMLAACDETGQRLFNDAAGHPGPPAAEFLRAIRVIVAAGVDHE